LIGIFTLQSALKKANYKPIPFSRLDWIILAFCAWIFFTGCIRGFGFLAFGGEQIGGFLYIRLFLAASLVITLPRLTIASSSWRSVLVIMAILASASLIADLLVMKGWDFQAVRVFVQTGQSADALENAADAADPMAMTRLWSAGTASSALLLCLLGLVPAQKFFRIGGAVWLAFFAGIFVLSLMSGFRLMTFSLLAIAGLTLFFQKGFTASRMIVLFVTGCVGLLFVYLFSRQFPNSIQRTISWLPGIDVSSIASGDASQTIEWRLRLWKEALRYLPDYWLVGKGFSYDKMEFIYAFQSLDDLRWALVSGSYHNGWLSMLLCTGVIGMVLCLILLVMPVVRHWKRQYATWKNPFFKRLHGVFLAALTITAGAFVAIYGEVHTSFPVIFFYWAILESLSRADQDEQSVSSDEDESSDFPESVYQEIDT